MANNKGLKKEDRPIRGIMNRKIARNIIRNQYGNRNLQYIWETQQFNRMEEGFRLFKDDLGEGLNSLLRIFKHSGKSPKKDKTYHTKKEALNLGRKFIMRKENEKKHK